jgi:23S rRNA pseudouridine2605 synthase
VERLQKIIAQAGWGSRREVERWILDGRVTVNGSVITQLGSKADPDRDKIKIDGKLVQPTARRTFLFHKPEGVITSVRDPKGRPDLGEWLDRLGRRGRLFPVGRLDFNSSGLLILTNDGELAQRLMHPRYQFPKVYRVKVSGHLSERDLNRLRHGIKLEEGMTAPAKIRVIKALKQKAWVEVEIREGRYREIRRMFEALGYSVEKLVRIRLGPLDLGTLPPGAMRPLSPREVAALKKEAGRVSS